MVVIVLVDGYFLKSKIKKDGTPPRSLQWPLRNGWSAQGNLKKEAFRSVSGSFGGLGPSFGFIRRTVEMAWVDVFVNQYRA